MKSGNLGGLVLVALSILVLVSVSLQPTSASSGAWRLLNPTEYTTMPTSNLNGVFMINGGTSGIGSGNGWAVGGNGLIFFWNGFAWYQATPLNTLCTYDSVNFGGPLNPIQNGVQTSSGWVVGKCSNSATSLYWNGISWQSYPVPAYATSESRSVFLVKSASSTTDNVIAVAVGIDGSSGAVWTWNGVPGTGAGWVELTPTPNQLNSVYMTSMYLSTCTGPGVQGVAVGDSGTILTYCGTWSSVSSPVSVALNGVAMSSPTSGWAVGDSCTIVQTTNGVTWSQYTGPTPCSDPSLSLRSIVLLSSSEGWAVGDSDSNGHPVILHGTSLDSSPTWTQIPTSQVTPNGIPSTVNGGLNSVTFATSGNNLWAVGASGIAAFCQNNCSSGYGSIWSTTTSPLTGSGTGHQLNSVFMDSDNDGWAVGSNDAGGPVLFQWNGYSWTQAASIGSITTSPLYGVYMQGSSNAWAVGGTASVASTLYYNGNTWEGLATPSCTCSLESVFMISGSETWAVGTDGVIMHSITQGGGFGTATSPVAGTANLDTVYFDSSQSGWAGGICTAAVAPCFAVNDPIIIHTATDGGDNWADVFTAGHGLPTASGTKYTVTSLFFQDSTHGWAAAASGNTNPTVIFYWNGISWTLVSPITTLTKDDLFGIAVDGGTPATDGWAVGVDSSGKPLMIHYDGSAWTEIPVSPSLPNPGPLTALYLRSSTNGLAVGGNAGSDTLALALHLDPPGSFQNTLTPQTTAQTPSTSISSQISSQVSTSTSAATESVTTTSSITTTVVSTSLSTMTVVSTPTTTSSSTTISVSTPMVLPAIPGFPWESIIAGIILGITALAIDRRRKK